MTCVTTVIAAVDGDVTSVVKVRAAATLCAVEVVDIEHRVLDLLARHALGEGVIIVTGPDDGAAVVDSEEVDDIGRDE